MHWATVSCLQVFSGFSQHLRLVYALIQYKFRALKIEHLCVEKIICSLTPMHQSQIYNTPYYLYPCGQHKYIIHMYLYP
jgi:hypothetical protein